MKRHAVAPQIAVLMALARAVVGMRAQHPGAVIVLDIGTLHLPDARSRMNTVFMVCYFSGGAMGAVLGTTVADAAGSHWLAIMAVLLALAASALNLLKSKEKSV